MVRKEVLVEVDPGLHHIKSICIGDVTVQTDSVIVPFPPVLVITVQPIHAATTTNPLLVLLTSRNAGVAAKEAITRNAACGMTTAFRESMNVRTMIEGKGASLITFLEADLSHIAHRYRFWNSD